MKHLISTRDAADYVGLSEQTLANWRYLNRGPRWFKVGGRVKYDVADLDAWIEAGAVDGDRTPDAAA